MPKIAITLTAAELENLFNRHLAGESIRQIAISLNCDSNTLRRRFLKRFGVASVAKKKNSLMPVLKEYLTNSKLTTRQKQELKEWIKNNAKELVRGDSERVCYSERGLDTQIETENRRFIAISVRGRGELTNEIFTENFLYQCTGSKRRFN